MNMPTRYTNKRDRHSLQHSNSGLFNLYLLIILVCTISLISHERALANTCVVAFWSPTEIIIGADSKRMGVVFEGGLSRRFMTESCKIVQFGKIFFASSGLVEDSKVLYEATSLAREACGKDTMLSKKVSRFEKLIKTKLLSSLYRTQREAPVHFKKTFETGDRVIAQFFFAGYEQEQLRLIAIDFMLSTSRGGALNIVSERNECPGCGRGDRYIMVIGQKEAIRKFYPESGNYFKIAHPVDIVRTLIELEIVDKSDEVGYPIDIIRIDKTGAKWIQRKQSCPDTVSKADIK
ncbi:MAG: hypothetical protein ACLP9S_04605 [Syntrophales bacterium]